MKSRNTRSACSALLLCSLGFLMISCGVPVLDSDAYPRGISAQPQLLFREDGAVDLLLTVENLGSRLQDTLVFDLMFPPAAAGSTSLPENLLLTLVCGDPPSPGQSRAYRYRLSSYLALRADPEHPPRIVRINGFPVEHRQPE
jgi:hypothetical protein